MVDVVKNDERASLIKFSAPDELEGALFELAKHLPSGVRLCYLPIPNTCPKESGYLGLMVDEP